MRKAYQSDLSDAEWGCLEPHLPAPEASGRPRLHSPREILDAIFYVLKSGCAWRLLPHDFPPWKTAYHYFRAWTAEIVRHPPKPIPEEVMMRWVREFNKEGLAIDPKRFMPKKGPRPFLPKRWVVERTFSWLSQNRRMSKDYERLPESGEAFIYAAMSRLMARRLAHL